MKKILITGATDGIGLATAKKLVHAGHPLILHGRSENKLQHTLESLHALEKNAELESIRADFSDLRDVRSFTESILSKHDLLDVIINNAGVFKASNTDTKEGLDLRFVVNTFAPCLIANELQAIMADDGRIVNLSSAAQAPVNLRALAGTEKITDDFQAYAQSKLALTVWSQFFAKALKPKQISVAVNPGSLLASKMVKEGFGLAGNDINIGADILVRAALSDEFICSSGLYFDNDARAFAEPHSDATNENKCEQIIKGIDAVVSKLSV